MCDYNAAGLLFKNPNLTNTACTNTPQPGPPVALSNVVPGDYCNSTRGDTCNNGAACTNSICTSKNTIGSNCSVDTDCPVGAYCNLGFKNCTATIAPGGSCTGNSFTPSSQCGY